MKYATLPLLFLFFGLFLIYPLVVLLGGAFFIESAAKSGAHHFSLEYFFLAFSSPFYGQCFLNSFLIAVFSTTLSLAVALPLAQIFLRRQFPLKTLLQVLLLSPLILPPFVGVIGIRQMFSRFGSVNLLLSKLGLVDLQQPPDWFGSGGFVGIILLQTLHLYPIMFLSVQAALANIDPSLRDAARNLGANEWRIFRTITMPLALPGIFAGSSIVFVSAFTDLGVPLMFGYNATVPTQIFNLVTQPDNPMGYVLVVLMLLVVAIFFTLGKKFGEGNYAMMGRSASYDDVKPFSPIAGWGVAAAVFLLVLFSCLPHLGVILQSFSTKWFMSIMPMGWTTDYYGEVFTLKLTATSIRNSLVYASLSCVVDLILGVVIAYLLARKKFVGKGFLDVLVMLPLALPGIVLAFASLVAFSVSPFKEIGWLNPIKNPTFLLVMVYAIHRIPYIVRAAYAGFQQTSVTLEEASSNLGANEFYTLRKITLPLIGANLVAGLILTFSFAMLDVSNGMILAQESPFYPLTKAIFALMGRITPTAPAIACALGVLAMVLLGASLFFASKLLGKKMGQLFRA